jgi:hypothetical protein
MMSVACKPSIIPNSHIMNGSTSHTSKHQQKHEVHNYLQLVRDINNLYFILGTNNATNNTEVKMVQHVLHSRGKEISTVFSPIGVPQISLDIISEAIVPRGDIR